MRIGMICRFDNSGLGNLSWEMARHLKPHKILLVENGVFQVFPERYDVYDTRRVKQSATIEQDDINWLCDNTDVIISCETFYNNTIPGIAKSKGVKTALVTMFEMFPERPRCTPDLYLCPSVLDYEVMPNPKVFVPLPVAIDVLPWKERKVASHFVHIGSHGGMNYRKGTPLIIEAMKHVKSDIKLTIYSWQNWKVDDERVEVKVCNFKNYWQLWQEGDVLIYPQDYNGISLPIVEALTSGLAIISTDIYPFNEFLPKEGLFEPTKMYRTRAAQGLIEVDTAKIDPVILAQKIDEMAGKDITGLSHYGKRWREDNSWEKFLPQYIKALQNLCSKD